MQHWMQVSDELAEMRRAETYNKTELGHFLHKLV
jgi:hypothetical protein